MFSVFFLFIDILTLSYPFFLESSIVYICICFWIVENKRRNNFFLMLLLWYQVPPPHLQFHSTWVILTSHQCYRCFQTFQITYLFLNVKLNVKFDFIHQIYSIFFLLCWRVNLKTNLYFLLFYWKIPPWIFCLSFIFSSIPKSYDSFCVCSCCLSLSKCNHKSC